jgi:ferric-dicitrate binding protein FerR (iron transport regulator)
MNDEMLVKFLLDEVTEDERAKVEGWISLEPANEKYFNHFELIWQQSKVLAASTEMDENAAWDRFKRRVENNNAPAIVVPFKKKFNWLRVAAVFIITVSVATVFYLVTNTKTNRLELASNDVILNDTLPDNSVVTLNKNSTLSYHQQSGIKSYRKAVLKGEGFFRVKPDKSKPFFVEVAGIEVKVVGTSFNIKGLADVTEIIVESGVVTVSKENKMVTLQKGEKLTIPRTGSIPDKKQNDDQLYNYYMSREFVCDKTPLWKLVQVLNEAYETTIIIENESAKKELLTTTFYNEPIENIVAVIAETFELTVSKKGNQIILR